MARPRKNSSNDLIILIDKYFSEEAAGDPSKLKGSLLEKYASEHGCSAKSYDFRRDPDVQAHISYLKKLVSMENDVPITSGNSYKTLDIQSLIQKYRNNDSLISVLSEMDAYWKSVYDAACSANTQLNSCRAQISSLQHERDCLKATNIESAASIRSLTSDNYRLTVENRYLRSMLRTYLYPAVADKILQEEHVVNGGSEALLPAAENTLIDASFPSSLSEVVKEDRLMQSKEDQLLRQMWNSVGGNPDE